MRTFTKMALVMCMGVASLGICAHAQVSESAQTGVQIMGGKATPEDRMFLTESAQANMAEIQEGKLATQNSNNPAVQKFGQKMIDDHASLTATMKPIMDYLHMDPPTMLAPKDQETINRLQNLHGAEFDRAYMMAAVNDHTEVLAKVKNEHAHTTNFDLKHATANAQVVVAEHLKMAQKLVAQVGR